MAKNQSTINNLFANAINHNALDKAMKNKKSRKEIEKILAKINY